MLSLIEASELFDPQWYVATYPDVALTGLSPAQHYLDVGASLLRDPGPGFSTSFYLAEHTDVARSGANPLVHYETGGREEGRRVAPAGHTLPPALPEHPVPLLDARDPIERPARVISFYLPQYHPIPENDAWWGEGFTEWTNVRPARSQMARQHQPHVPGELGYYDLRDPEVQRRQVELARRYGVEAFCFYFYWFGGTRLLETPIRNYLDDQTLDLPFLLCWANENWSRRWDGREDDVLMAQSHSPEDDLAFIEHVAEYMRDPRYLRVDDKPMLLVYRPSLLPDPRETTERWRTWCRENGIGDIHLAYTQSFESNDPRDYGFDAAIEFPPNNSGIPRVNQQHLTRPDFAGHIYDWSALLERSYAYGSKPYPLYRGVCPSWDNTARRGQSGTILVNNTPGRFARWTTHAIRDATQRFGPDERFVFVNAWNEWAEGTHLEPDSEFGYAWLESIRVALACAAESRPISRGSATIAVVAHITGPDIAGIVDLCESLPGETAVVATCPIDVLERVAAALESAGVPSEIVPGPAPGMEWSPLHAVLPRLVDGDFDLVVRVGRSTTDDYATRAVDDLVADSRLGLVMPEDSGVSADGLQVAARGLGERLGLTEDEIEHVGRWRGSAFVARATALAPLAALAVEAETFRPGSIRHDPSLSEAFDRAVALSAQAAGLNIQSDGEEPAGGGRNGVIIVSHDAHPHGAQRLALCMARDYREMGLEVHMVVLGAGPMLEQFRQVATVHEVDLDHDPTSSTLRLLGNLRARGVGFAIANTTVSGRLAPLLRSAKIPVVSLIHELPGVLESYDLGDHAAAIAEHADAVVFPARLVRRGFEEFHGEPVDRGTIRPQGLYLRNPHRSDEDRYAVRRAIRDQLGLAGDARIMLGVGYADHRKGIDLFAEAAAAVLSARPDAAAVWVGKAGDPDLFEKAVGVLRAHGVEDRFRLTGNVDNPEDFYSAADVFVLTSREDPFPSVVLEALDTGLPSVAFAGATGCEELLGRGLGVLVPGFDSGAMAREISDLLQDPERAVAMGREGRAVVEAEFGFRDYLHDLAGLAGIRIPKVSVVVPNYNYGDHIEDRLASVLAQAGFVHELIVLDDASTDDSVEKIRSFLDHHDVPARLVVNDRNSGSVFAQWLRGVEMATGDHVWIAEADDLADPGFLSEVLPAFDDPAVVVSYCQSRQMASDGSILNEHYLDYVADVDDERWTRPYVADGQREIAEAMFVKNTIPNVSGVVFRRQPLLEVLQEHYDTITSYRVAGDWVVYLQLLERGKVAFSPRSLNSHRRHAGSVTVGNFNIRQLQEIVRVQRATIGRHALGEEAAARAGAYAQRLYEQFGLVSEAHPTVTDHPDLQDGAGLPSRQEEGR